MHELDSMLIFTRPLDDAGVSYMVAGSVASIIYGEPRLTNDVDVVLYVDDKTARQMEQIYPPALFYCPPIEVILVETRRAQRGHFNIIHHQTGLKAVMYMTGSEALQAWGMAYRQRMELDANESVWVAPMEYVILKKLQYFREGQSGKHLLDIQGMMHVSGEWVDHDFLQDQLDRLHLRAEWEKARGS